MQARILIVDDERNSFLLRGVLEREGYRNVVEVCDAAKAVGVCSAIRPDIVLLNLKMAAVDCFALLKQFRSCDGVAPELPILAFAGDLDTGSKRKALELGANDFIVKASDEIELLVRVSNFLQMRLLNWELQRDKEVLERKVQTRTAQLEEARLDALHLLARAAEFRDDATGEHIRRVGALSAAIAGELEKCDLSPELMGLAAPLHDVGKIGISDSILLKPGPLTVEEFEAMKHHTTIGFEILRVSHSPVLRLAASIAISHHERWDGTGYPRGLAGEDIPIEGRIVAVADVFDALTKDRPYKRAWSHEAAFAEIYKGSGRQFDSEVVTAFACVYSQQHKAAA